MSRHSPRVTPLLAAIVIASASVATASDDGWLRDEVWREHAHGVSLRPPADATLFERIVPDSVPWTLGGGGPKQVVLTDLAARFRLEPIRKELRRQRDREARRLLDAIVDDRTLTPRGHATFLAHSNDDALLRMEGHDGYAIRLYVRSTKNEVRVNQVGEAAIGQVAHETPSAVVTEQRKTKIADQPAVVLVYKIPDRQEGDRARVQSIVQLDRRHFAMLQLDVPHILLRDVRPIYRQVQNSIRITPQKELKQARHVLIEAGRQWLEGLNKKRLAAIVRPSQLLRIVQEGHQGNVDIGYLRVRTERTTELHMPGVAILVNARVRSNEHVHDTDSRFFLSLDGRHEMWKINTTARSAVRGAAASKPALSWAETGLRSGDRIEVHHQDLSGPNTRHWKRPPGYVSQVLVHLLDGLIPHEQPGEYGFYAYLPSDNELAFRTINVTPREEGGFLVLTRSSPKHGLSVAEYDAEGKLVARRMPGRRWLIPTDGEELARLWGAAESK